MRFISAGSNSQSLGLGFGGRLGLCLRVCHDYLETVWLQCSNENVNVADYQRRENRKKVRR